jgi:hypothetical protein
VFSVRQKVVCILWLVELKSYIHVWHKFNEVYPKQTALICRSVMHWDKHLKETGSVLCHTIQCSCGNGFPVRWCTTSHVWPCSCLSGQGISWSLDRKKGTHSLALLFSRFDSSGFFLLGFVELHVNTQWETECRLDVSCATDGACPFWDLLST